MPIADFSKADRKRLASLGVIPEQVERLRFVLPIIQGLALASPPKRNETRDILSDIEKLADALVKKLGATAKHLTPEHGLVHALLQQKYWASPERMNDSGPTVEQHIIVRLNALSDAAKQSREELPKNQSRRIAGNPYPIEQIDTSLRQGWQEKHPAVIWVAKSELQKRIGQRAPSQYPELFSVGRNNNFHEIVRVCYAAAGGTHDPDRAIRAYQAATKKRFLELNALVAGKRVVKS